MNNQRINPDKKDLEESDFTEIAEFGSAFYFCNGNGNFKAGVYNSNGRYIAKNLSSIPSKHPIT